MTTIAYDGEVIASDSMCSNSGYDTLINLTTKKLHRTKAGGIVAAAGNIHAGGEIAKWMDGEREAPEDMPGPWFAVYIDPNGRPWVYDGTTKYCYPGEKKYAIGTGGSHAMAILDYGGTAVDAVRMALKRDVFSGGKIQFIRYKEISKLAATS